MLEQETDQETNQKTGQSIDQLVAIKQHKIGKTRQDSVNARDLHGFLETKTKFRHWIKRKLEQYSYFEEGVDYFSTVKNDRREIGAVTKKEYILTINMAKELAMLENNQIGQKVRRYFIACEQELKKYTSPDLSIAQISKDYKRAIRLAKSLGLEKAEATQKARDFMLEEISIDCFKLFPGSAQVVYVKNNGFSVSQMANKLQVERSRVMGILVNSFIISKDLDTRKLKPKANNNPYIFSYDRFTHKILYSNLCVTMLEACFFGKIGGRNGWDYKRHQVKI